MDKLKLAHSYMVEYVKKNGLDVSYSEVSTAFDIAEAMLAEQEKRADKTRPAVLDEFQVDWIKAPSEAEYWAMDSNGICYWYMTEPRLTEIFPIEWIGCGYPIGTQAPSFNYQGDWKDSLQECK